jgi:transcriptional regulator with XRE-family HTH domain
MTWDKIKQLMDKDGLTSKEVADIAGVVPSAITKWKAGASIRTDALQRIAVHFGVSSDWLLGTSTAPPEQKKMNCDVGPCRECAKKEAEIKRLNKIIDKLVSR